MSDSIKLVIRSNNIKYFIYTQTILNLMSDVCILSSLLTQHQL